MPQGTFDLLSINIALHGLQHPVSAIERELMPQLTTLEPALVPSFALQSLPNDFLRKFVVESVTTNRRVRGLALEVASQLWQEFTDPFYYIRVVIPLRNFESTRPFSIRQSIDSNDFTVRVVRSQRNKHPATYGFHTTSSHLQSVPFEMELDLCKIKWLALVDVRTTKADEYNPYGTAFSRGLSVALINVLRLFQTGDVDAPDSYTSSSLLSSAGSSARSSAWYKVLAGTSYRLDVVQIRRLKKFWKEVFPLLCPATKIPRELNVAMEYLQSSYPRPSQSKFLDLFIALESMLGVKEELKYRRSLRGSVFLGTSPDEIVRLYGELRDCYTIRNNIAHGAPEIKKPTFKKKVVESLPKLQNIVRRLIVRHLGQCSRFNGDGGYWKTVRVDFEREFILSRLSALSDRDVGEAIQAPDNRNRSRSRTPNET